MIKSICFVGKSNCGKTTLITKVISKLSERGYKIGTVKHHNHDTHFDQEGKDTYKHYMSGAKQVIISSPGGYGMFIKVEKELPLEEIIKMHEGMDLVIVEGYKREGINKIEIIRKERSSERICSDDEVQAVISDIEIETSRPYFNINDIDGVVKFIEERYLINK